MRPARPARPVRLPKASPALRLAPALVLAALVPALAALAPRPASALPMYALRQGLPCVACHFDPNGGGGRRELGFQYARNRHDMAPEDRWQDIVLSNKVGEALYFGTDLRQQYTWANSTGGDGTEVSTWFPMEGAFYATFAPFEKLVVTYNRDLRQSRDAYGLIRDLPAGLYFKAGQFRLPFGLRQDDHTSAMRAGFLDALSGGFGTTGFLPYDPRGVEGGLEVGVTPLSATNLTLATAFTNGGAPFENKAQCLTSKLYYNEERHFGGLSYYNNWRSTTHARDWRVAYYGGIVVVPRLVVLGEAGFGRSDDGAGASRHTDAFWAEADYKMSRTVLVRAKYDYVDANYDVEGEAAERFTAETDLQPLPFAELKLSWRYIRPEKADDQNQVLVQAHFSY